MYKTHLRLLKHERLPVAVERGLEFLKKHALRGADLSELKRKDTWSIPLVILREALVNAIVHADYSQRGSPFRIAFFDDRIEIESPGMFPPGITFEDMLQGVSKVRNHVIARVFREIGLIEQWGSGVPRMVEEAKKLGLPEPEIIEIGMRVRCIIRFAEVLVQSTPQAPRAESQLESQPESLALRVLEILAIKPASKAELSEKLGQREVSGQLHKVMRDLLAAGQVEYTLPDKPNSRLQKYRRV